MPLRPICPENNGAGGRPSTRYARRLHLITVRTSSACASQPRPVSRLSKPFACQTRVFVEVAKGAAPEAVPPPLPTMFRRVVQHMASLAQGRQIGRRVVTWVMIQMRAGQYDIGRPYRCDIDMMDCHAIASRGTPTLRIDVPPSAIAQVRNQAQMGAGASFTARFRPVKPNAIRQLLPVDRIEPTVFGADRHWDFMSQFIGRRKG